MPLISKPDVMASPSSGAPRPNLPLHPPKKSGNVPVRQLPPPFTAVATALKRGPLPRGIARPGAPPPPPPTPPPTSVAQTHGALRHTAPAGPLGGPPAAPAGVAGAHGAVRPPPGHTRPRGLPLLRKRGGPQPAAPGVDAGNSGGRASRRPRRRAAHPDAPPHRRPAGPGAPRGLPPHSPVHVRSEAMPLGPFQDGPRCFATSGSAPNGRWAGHNHRRLPPNRRQMVSRGSPALGHMLSAVRRPLTAAG